MRELLVLSRDNYKAIFARVFDASLPDDISLTDPEWHDDLAKLNPEGTVQVAYFEDIIESWTLWVQKSYYYVYKVPHQANIYLLFEISWDDNWSVWQRNPLAATESEDEIVPVGKVLLREYAKESLDGSGTGAWNEFLMAIIDNRLAFPSEEYRST
jgi:hypothetical protein